MHPLRPVFSARIGIGYRALCVRDGDTLMWFWIGSKEECEDLLARLGGRLRVHDEPKERVTCLEASRE